MTETRNILMDAAELLVAEHGYDGVTMRQLTDAAGVNLAAVNYHFGSKEGLLRETLHRRSSEIASRRRQLLQQIERESAKPAVLEQIIRALVLPVSELVDKHGEQGRAHISMRWRAAIERPQWMMELPSDGPGEVLADWSRLLREAVPELSEEELTLRARMASRLTFDCLAGSVKQYPVDTIVQQLILFTTAGLQAPGDIKR